MVTRELESGLSILEFAFHGYLAVCCGAEFVYLVSWFNFVVSFGASCGVDTVGGSKLNRNFGFELSLRLLLR